MAVAFLVFISLIAISMILHSRAMAKLTTEHKALVADKWSKHGIKPLIAIAVIYVIQTLVSLFLGYPSWILPVFIVVLLASSVAFTALDLRRLARLGLPAPYIRVVCLTELLTLGGFLLFCTSALYTIWSIKRP